MDEIFIPRPFELAGSFGGFVFTETGKRRMRLREGEHEHLLKVPRSLRHRIVGKFQPGQPIRVAGTEELDPLTDRLKRVVSRVLPDAASESPMAKESAVVCTIRVCAKKNCWRQGGRELWDAIQREVAEHGLADQVKLRQVGCLDRCKHAPNADCGDHAYSRCVPGDAVRLLARAVPGHFLKKQSSNAETVVGSETAVSAEIL